MFLISTIEKSNLHSPFKIFHLNFIFFITKKSSVFEKSIKITLFRNKSPLKEKNNHAFHLYCDSSLFTQMRSYISWTSENMIAELIDNKFLPFYFFIIIQERN